MGLVLEARGSRTAFCAYKTVVFISFFFFQLHIHFRGCVVENSIQALIIRRLVVCVVHRKSLGSLCPDIALKTAEDWWLERTHHSTVHEISTGDRRHIET